jgi:chromosome transmission fidelity protein 18
MVMRKLEHLLRNSRKKERRGSENLFYDPSFVSVTICISTFSIYVNGRYATSLRPLRPYCHILHIRPTQPSSLLPRLQKICHLEKIKADARALTLLADSHEGDLRACINSLQLLSTRCDNLTLSFVQEALLKSKKEGTLTSHTVTEGVFAKRTAKEMRRLNLTGQIEAHRVVNDFIACGETDRIMSGTFPSPRIFRGSKS